MHTMHRRRSWAVRLGSGGVVSCLALGAGCADGAFEPRERTGETGGALSAADGVLRGELATYIATYDDGHTEKTHYLLRGEEKLRLDVAGDLDIAPGSTVEVMGTRDGDLIRVVQGGVYAVAGPMEPKIIDAGAKPSRKMAVVLVDTGGGMGTITDATAGAAFFTGAKSVNAYYRENSYGIQGLDGKVLGPLSYAMSGCDTDGMAKAIKAQITEAFDQYAYVFKQSSACGWGGLASVGTPTKPSKDTWYNGSVSCVVAVQEPGHNYGMQHSSSMTCGTTTLTDSLASCTHSEYGDRFDPMGGGCRHMNVWQKQYQGWFGGCNGVKVTSSGTFNLVPTELACDGIQALQVPMPKARPFNRPAGGGGGSGTDQVTSYYLEYRTSAGFDTGMTPTVLLHAGGEYRTSSQVGLHTWLLDTHPGGSGGFNDAGFKAGESFTDPAGGLTITVQAMDADKATIKIDVTGGSGGAPTCLDGRTIAAPGPTTCGGIVVVGDAGGGGGTDAGTNPAPDAGGGTTPPDAGGGTTPPDAGNPGTTDAGGGTVADSGGIEPNPGNGGRADSGSTGIPGSGGGTGGATSDAGGAAPGDTFESPAEAAGCGCAVPGTTRGAGTTGPLAALVSALGLVIAGRRRRAKHV
jgi:hypothetical protein